MSLPSEFLERGWCQRVGSMDKDGNSTLISKKKAVKWCYMGAAAEVFGRGSDKHKLFGQLGSQILAEGKLRAGVVPNWNDKSYRTQAEVVALAKLVEIKMGLRTEPAECPECGEWEHEGGCQEQGVGVIELVERTPCLV